MTRNRSRMSAFWLKSLPCTAVLLSMTVSARAQTTTCTTTGTQTPSCAPTFSDVPTGYWAWCFVNSVAQHGIMPGCGGDMFCPDGVVTRGDMAVFLENAKHLVGGQVTFSAASGIFSDVPASFPLACWIEQFYNDGITAGCGTNPPRYCPDAPVTRAEMAVFILLTKHVRGWTVPQCTGIFTDVPCPGGFAVNYIEELYNECITAGCSMSPLNYCPNSQITRAQMAVYLWSAFLTTTPCTASCS